MNHSSIEASTELVRGVHAALETYSNVHRGSGHNSMVTTYLYDQAREIVLEYLGLKKDKYTVIFCTAARAAALEALLDPKSYQCLSDQETGLSLGIRALAVKRNALPKGNPFQSGGGTTSLISRDWVIWAGAPDKFEAGTPPIVNVITFAKALKLMRQYGKDIFRNEAPEKLSASEILYQDELEKYSGRELLDELRKSHIGRGVRVPTMEGLKSFINLDNGASSPAFTPVWNAFLQTLHLPVSVKQEIIQQVKSICARALGAPSSDYDILFTSNTTEAINLVAESLSREPGDIEPVVLNTLLEHSSNDLPWRMIQGCTLIRLQVDAEGFLDLNELETILSAYNEKGLHGKKRVGLVTVSGASNVLGTCNNLAEISRIVHKYSTHMLVDAAQLVAHRKVNMEECGIDYLAFSAHKVYAPFGCGVLAARKGLLNFNAAELEQIRSSGEENTGGIAALGKILVLLQRIGMDRIMEEEQALTARALRGMKKIEGLTVYGVTDPDSPGFAHKLGVIVFGMKSMFSNQVAEELSLRRGIGIRYGCHCAHIIIKRLLHVSPFLERFQWLILTLFPKTKLPGLARVSLGIENSEEDVDTLIHVLEGISKKHVNRINGRPCIAPEGHAVLSKPEVKKQMKEFMKAAAVNVYSQPG
jgi:selenocysteine lyase/cysteine desulfurase